MTTAADVGFHLSTEASKAAELTSAWFGSVPAFRYTFDTFFHPFVGELTQRLNRASVPGMLDPSFVGSLSRDVFDDIYGALETALVAVDDAPEDVDLREGGPYANYNWELLFHIPLTVAVHLSRNQRFAEAQRWFHLIFDPTCNDATPAPQRFWKFLRFRTATPQEDLGELLALLSKPATKCTQAELDRRQVVLDGYDAIRKRPFQPHAVARTRPMAYQYSVVMKYLDNVIAWGDSLFMQDTIESINEATQCYVLAANILGPRPEQLPQAGRVRARTFDELKAAGLDAMGNALVELEGQFPFNFTMPPAPGNGQGQGSAPLFGVGRTLYFCIPRNERLLEYWNVVGDRLFKIRNCMNIQGVVRPLALFDPPLDPGALVRAAAAGIDVGSIVSGLNQPLGPVRCLPLLQRALELCAEVRALGAGVLSAIEKRDAEDLALLRQGHEIAIQQLAKDTRFLQVKQAEEATQGLLRSRANALERYRYHLRLLGLQPDAQAAPETFTLDRRELTEDTFDEAFAALVTQYDRQIAPLDYPRIPRDGGTSPSAQSGASGTGGLHLTVSEAQQLNVYLPQSRDLRLRASVMETIATVLTFIPDFDVKLAFWGLGAGAGIFGGIKMSDALKIGAEITRTQSNWQSDQAQMASITASYERRVEEWTQQANLAATELRAIGRQILGSLIAEQVARHELAAADRQFEHAREVDRFMREDKRAGQELYAWMQGELSRLYYEYYRFAVDTARKAERTMKHELMRPELDGTDFVRFNYWDRGREGLLAAEALYLDLKRMELAYHENNRRELELTRHVSLRQLDPLALLALRGAGRCEVSIPEWFWDRDHPGGYMRRVKSVALSLHSVAGPYTTVNCTLTLLRSRVRVSPSLDAGAYEPSGSEDPRFVEYLGAVESVVTSSGANDSGMFEANLRDERVLPFEGAGAISTWRLELPSEFPAFDYTRVSDAILHVRYTARSGGATLAEAATGAVRTVLEDADTSGMALLLSLPHDFPTEWAAFAGGTGDLVIRLRRAAFPYMVQAETLAVESLELFAPSGAQRSLNVSATLADDVNGPPAYGTLTVAADANVLRRAAKEVYLVVRFAIE